MRRSVVETILGAVVLGAAALFAVVLYNQTPKISQKTYSLTAKFDRIDGVREGSEVRVSGIPVGRVTSSELDNSSFLAKVKLELDDQIKLPSDSALEITSDGLFGKKYLAITMGSDEEYIENGGEITYTQAGADLMQLVSKFMFSDKATGDSKEQENKVQDISMIVD